MSADNITIAKQTTPKQTTAKLKAYKFRVNYGLLEGAGGSPRNHIADTKQPVISWAVQTTQKNSYQVSYSAEVYTVDKVGKKTFYQKTGTVEAQKQEFRYSGAELPNGEKIYFTVRVTDNYGNTSSGETDWFYMGVLEAWEAPWIVPQNDEPGKVIHFRREYTPRGKVETATFYVCGIGYHKIAINGARIDPSRLDPAHSDYSKRCYYAVLPEVEKYLTQEGSNKIEIQVADGWRRINSDFIRKNIGERSITFDGIPQLSAMLTVKYEDGTTDTLMTDQNWQAGYGQTTFSNIYDGEVYDAREEIKCGQSRIVPAPGGVMMPQSLEPIRCLEEYSAVEIFAPKDNVYVIDFGQNVAGVVRMRLPENMSPGQEITLKYAEFLNEDGTVFAEPLRQARCMDKYIASGDWRDLEVWQPEFTYHGYRYVQLEGYSSSQIINKADFVSVAEYTDLNKDGHFTCGNPLIDRIHKNVMQTERANMHSVLTDCPQRDERMGWMNDATVRFEETPYNFEIGRMFPKIVRDIIDTLGDEGEMTCTAPFIFGMRPADPVCSSFLVAAHEAYMHTGNADIIKEGYESFRRWEDYLLSRSDDYIVNYSYYGDWAAPSYACVTDEFAASAVTPGILMSTGYSYYNCKLLAKFASVLGLADEAKHYKNIAGHIQAAFLAKWFAPESATVATGSQGCQAFALWLEILPVEARQKAADIMHRDLLAADYKITTGNLCTRYLLDMLTKYGYIEDAWRIMTRMQYPSIGFTINHEATTIWERFELKRNPDMNSHNHPMYGACDYWLHSYLAGIRIDSPACEHITIKPYFPEGLYSVNDVYSSVKGDIVVKWVKRYGRTVLYLSIPFGVKADVYFGQETADGLAETAEPAAPAVYGSGDYCIVI